MVSSFVDTSLIAALFVAENVFRYASQSVVYK